jgi:hypothetical protein
LGMTSSTGHPCEYDVDVENGRTVSEKLCSDVAFSWNLH